MLRQICMGGKIPGKYIKTKESMLPKDKVLTTTIARGSSWTLEFDTTEPMVAIRWKAVYSLLNSILDSVHSFSRVRDFWWYKSTNIFHTRTIRIAINVILSFTSRERKKEKKIWYMYVCYFILKTDHSVLDPWCLPTQIPYIIFL